METGVFWDLGRVSDTQLRSGLSSLLANGYRTEARIIAHIAEVEQRKLHATDGSPSLFEYCVRQLGLSESEAFHRLTAARIARRYPIVFSLIESRQIHLTAVCLLRDYLSSENHLELLAEASNKTQLQVQELLARRFPRPDVASYVRKLPLRAAGERSPPSSRSDTSALPTPGPTSVPSISSPPPADSPQLHAAIAAQIAPAPARALIEPISEARYRIQLNASSALKEKLELFRALVSHSIPNGDVAAVLPQGAGKCWPPAPGGGRALGGAGRANHVASVAKCGGGTSAAAVVRRPSRGQPLARITARSRAQPPRCSGYRATSRALNGLGQRYLTTISGGVLISARSRPPGYE